MNNTDKEKGDSALPYFYHGSIHSGITQLEARSKLHNTEETVVYLTDCLPYALFYIWDAEHNAYSGKYVTSWVNGGIAYYEEQFPDQLKTFYQGVSGNLYCVEARPDIQGVEGRNHLYSCSTGLPVSKVIQIPDVYEALLKSEAEGTVTVLRYRDQSSQRQTELTHLIARAILRANFYQDDPQQQAFMQRHFAPAWKIAEDLSP